MTRKQVADRLGRSLATVRRLEGVLLHPRRDARGVHHFERDEVEALARDLDAGRVSAGTVDESPEQREDDGPCPECSALRDEVDALGGELDAARRNHRREVDALRVESERIQSRLRAELSALEREVAEFVTTVEGALG